MCCCHCSYHGISFVSLYLTFNDCYSSKVKYAPVEENFFAKNAKKFSLTCSKATILLSHSKKNSPQDSSTNAFFTLSPYMTSKPALGNIPAVVIMVTTFVLQILLINAASKKSIGFSSLLCCFEFANESCICF